MRPSLVIPHLRTACPVFANRVAGASQLRTAIGNDNLAVPHAFVVLIMDRAADEAILSPLQQEIVSRFAVIVAVANTSDERGQSASEALCDIKRDLLTALVGWTPDLSRYSPCLYEGMPEDPDSTRERAWAQFDFISTATSAGTI